MTYTLDKLIDILLSKSEQFEDELKKESDLQNLTINQLHCIELINELHNPTLSELAERLKITKPSTTALIEKLIGKGYVVKVKSDTDRRSAHLHLTDKGAKASELHSNVHYKIGELLTNKLSDAEKDILIVLLNKATQGLL